MYTPQLPRDCPCHLHAASQGKHPVRPLSHKNLPAKAPLLTMSSNLLCGKRQPLEQVSLRAYIASPIFRKQSRNPQKKCAMNLSETI